MARSEKHTYWDEGNQRRAFSFSVWRHNPRQQDNGTFEELVSPLGMAGTLFENADKINEDD